MQPNRDKAIKDINLDNEIEEIIKKCKTCHIAMIDEEQKPYLLAFNFGYKDKTIYLHSGKTGRKIDILKNNNNVCVYFDIDQELFARNEEVACSWRMRYRSVLANGKAEFVDDFDEKHEILKIFMENYSDLNFKFSKPAINNVLIIKIKLETWSGRSFEY